MAEFRGLLILSISICKKKEKRLMTNASFPNGDHPVWPGCHTDPNEKPEDYRKLARITVGQILSCSIQELVVLDAQELARLQGESVKAMESAKLTKDRLDGVLDRKYADRVTLLRQQAGKDFGTVRFNDGNVTITANLPKRAVWDQEKLEGIVEHIRRAGDDPGEYVDVSYKVPERKFTAWPEHIRGTFEAARTVKSGKPVFKLAFKKTEAV